LDSQNPARSPIFSANAFGGDGDASTGCVTSGTFANWMSSVPSQQCLRRQFDGGRGVIQAWPSPEAIAAVLLSSRNCKFLVKL